MNASLANRLPRDVPARTSREEVNAGRSVVLRVARCAAVGHLVLLVGCAVAGCGGQQEPALGGEPQVVVATSSADLPRGATECANITAEESGLVPVGTPGIASSQLRQEAMRLLAVRPEETFAEVDADTGGRRRFEVALGGRLRRSVSFLEAPVPGEWMLSEFTRCVD